ncbi:MAG TPA: hypothetical protein VFR02_05200, partial [bacterium]|nr:hypothetical protein [bacterium]
MARTAYYLLGAVLFTTAFLAFRAWELGRGQAPVVPGGSPLALHYDFHFAPPFFHYDLDAGRIAALKADKDGVEDHRILGLTVADFDLGSQYQFEEEHSWMASDYTFWLKELTVRFGYKSIDVYVARRYPKTSCAFQITLSHENDHVNIHRNLYLKYADILRRTLADGGTLPDRAHPVTALSQDEGKAELEKRVAAVLDPVFQDFQKELAEQEGEL